MELSLANLVITDDDNAGTRNSLSNHTEAIPASIKPIVEKASVEINHLGSSLETEEAIETGTATGCDTVGDRIQDPLDGPLESKASSTESGAKSAELVTNSDSSQELNENLLLSPEELTPIDIDSFLLPIDHQQQQQGDEFLAHVLLSTFGDQGEEFNQPNEVDDCDFHFLLTETLEDIEFEDIEPDSLDTRDYDNIFGDSDHDLLASLENDLIKLTLEPMSNSAPIDGQSENESEQEGFDLPPFMYCQPIGIDGGGDPSELGNDLPLSMYCQPIGIDDGGYHSEWGIDLPSSLYCQPIGIDDGGDHSELGVDLPSSLYCQSIGIDDGGDHLELGYDLPSSMYCQPIGIDDDGDHPDLTEGLNECRYCVVEELHPIDEDAPLEDGEQSVPQPRRQSGFDEVPFTLQGIDQLPENPAILDQSFQAYVVSRRPEAVSAALSFTKSFGTGIYQPIVEDKCPKNEMQFLGHKETIFGLNFSPCGTYMATASQDSTIRVWNVGKHQLLQTLTGYSKDAECLRVAWAPWTWGDDILDRVSEHKYLLATGGADGIVKLWAASKAEDIWTCLYTLDHGSFGTIPTSGDDREKEPPQIYTVQFIGHWKGLVDSEFECNNFLMTSSEDFIHLWEVSSELINNGQKLTRTFKLIEVISIRFTCLDDFGCGVSVMNVTTTGLCLDDKYSTIAKRREAAEDGNQQRIPYGGERNPHGVIYVFDAQYCQANGLLGVALSDGSLRLVNGRGVCVAPITLPGNNSHLTSFCWDATGVRLASCVASGHLILWDVHVDGHIVTPSCKAVLEGGHIPGRPLYGAAYCGIADFQDLILSWGVDGRLCLWDSHSDGNIHAPISTLVSRPDYPLYAVDVDSSCDGDGKSKRIARIGCGGGGFGDAGFIGVPVYVYEVTMVT